MVYRKYYPPRDSPSEISVPEHFQITPPSFTIPEKIKVFFGKTGKWWGSWRSPQARGTFDAVLIINSIKDDQEAEVVCSVPDYPQWYIKKDMWETTGKFSKKDNGRVILLIPYNPFGTTMECWFE